jgi:hypothetical protein
MGRSISPTLLHRLHFVVQLQVLVGPVERVGERLAAASPMASAPTGPQLLYGA